MSAYYNEIDPFAAQWLRNLITAGHIAPGDVDERSIEDVQPGDLVGYAQCHFFAGIGVWSHALRNAGWPDDREVWTGSCPCQSFSAAGSGRGFDDRRHLWPHFFRLIREQRPRTVFGEQVASKDGLAWLDFVCADMEGAGYAIAPVDLCAAGFGAPHIRQRLYFVADATNTGRQAWSGDGIRNAGAVVSASAVTHGSEPCELAHADGWNASPEGIQRSRQYGQFAPDGGASGMADPAAGGLGINGSAPRDAGHTSQRDTVGDVGNAVEQGSQGRIGPGDVELHGTAGADGSTTPPSFWSACDWLPCRDGKARPVESGTFPLVDRATNRVGRLRGYGNAIVGPVAQGFIEAFMECQGDKPCAPQI